MPTGQDFLIVTIDELAAELRKRIKLAETPATPARKADPAMDAIADRLTWHPVAQSLASLMVQSWILAAAAGQCQIDAKEAWTKARTTLDLCAETGLTDAEVLTAETAAWEVFLRTPSLAVSAVFPKGHDLYMVRRVNGVVVASPFPAP